MNLLTLSLSGKTSAAPYPLLSETVLRALFAYRTIRLSKISSVSPRPSFAYQMQSNPSPIHFPFRFLVADLVNRPLSQTLTEFRTSVNQLNFTFFSASSFTVLRPFVDLSTFQSHPRSGDAKTIDPHSPWQVFF
jgi:hypothetical protein